MRKQGIFVQIPPTLIDGLLPPIAMAFLLHCTIYFKDVLVTWQESKGNLIEWPHLSFCFVLIVHVLNPWNADITKTWTKKPECNLSFSFLHPICVDLPRSTSSLCKNEIPLHNRPKRFIRLNKNTSRIMREIPFKNLHRPTLATKHKLEVVKLDNRMQSLE